MITSRTRGLGSVYQRGATWWIKFYVNGKPIRQSSESERQADAVRLLKRRLEELAGGRFVPNADKVTFADLWTMLEDDYAMHGRPLRRLKVAHTHLKASFGPDLARSITGDRLTRYAHTRQEEGAALATIQQELALLRRAFNLAIRSGRLMHRPAFPTLRVSNARQGFFEPGDLAALLVHLPDYLHPVVRFAYLTGWRVPSEILPLTWDRVDFTAGTVRLEVGTTKNGEGRTFPFDALPDLKALLEDQRARTTALVAATGDAIPTVFHRHGAPIKDFRHAWKVACAAAQLVGKIPHDFRRTAVRNLERAGVSRSVAMQLTGHKTESVYRRYAIVAEADLREGVEKLAALHGSHEEAST
jgi:integrase